MEGDTVTDRTHCMFAHAEVDVAILVCAFLEVTGSFDFGEVGVGKVSGTADQTWENSRLFVETNF